MVVVAVVVKFGILVVHTKVEIVDWVGTDNCHWVVVTVGEVAVAAVVEVAAAVVDVAAVIVVVVVGSSGVEQLEAHTFDKDTETKVYLDSR